jgi:uncharacterized protein (TIGR02118 family)
MTLAYFLHVDGPEAGLTDFQAWADESFGTAVHRADADSCVEAFAPRSVDDPYLGKETGKLLIVQATFSSREALEHAMAGPEVSAALASVPRHQGARVTGEAFTLRACPLLDGSTPPRRAPVSFVVRYYRPIERERQFTDYYVGHHPPIMARFPGIRNIYCYLPVACKGVSSVTPSGSFLGNEIVFDSIEDLAAALHSDVRHDLRADYRHFLPHEGEVTHFAMSRRVLFPGAAD